MPGIDTSRPFIPVRIAVLTVSDSRGLAEDRSGQTLIERLETAGHILGDRKIVRDELTEIQRVIKGWLIDPDIDVIISTGGTGAMSHPKLSPVFLRRKFRDLENCSGC